MSTIPTSLEVVFRDGKWKVVDVLGRIQSSHNKKSNAVRKAKALANKRGNTDVIVRNKNDSLF